MNQAEKAELLEQLEQWNKKDEYSRCIRAIEAIPEQERGYLLTVKLSRAYSNLAVLGDHGEHGTDGEVDGDLIRHAIELLESVRAQGAVSYTHLCRFMIWSEQSVICSEAVAELKFRPFREH